MELRHIKELMASMGRTGLKKLVIKKDDFELEIERECTHNAHESFFDDAANREFHNIRRAPQSLPKPEHTTLAQAASSEPSGTFITSPMVGTFYAAPSPDDAPFVKPGDKVEKNTVVCIVEAMKVMNEIKAGQSGTISEILAESATPVEFGTKLFRIV